MKPLKIKISITIDSDIIETLKILAKSDDRSLSQYINIILIDYIKNKTKIRTIKSKRYFTSFYFQSLYRLASYIDIPNLHFIL